MRDVSGKLVHQHEQGLEAMYFSYAKYARTHARTHAHTLQPDPGLVARALCPSLCWFVCCAMLRCVHDIPVMTSRSPCHAAVVRRHHAAATRPA